MALPDSEVPKRINVSLVAIHRKHTDETWGVYYAPDGENLISSDGTALYFWRWDGQTWNYSHTLTISALFPCFAPNSDIFAFRDAMNNLRILSVDGSLIASLSHPQQARTDGIFLTDGQWFLTIDIHGQLVVWNIQNSEYHILPDREILQTKALHPQWLENHQYAPEPHYLQRTPDSTLLIFTRFANEGNASIYRFDSIHWRLKKEKTLPIQGALGLKIAPNGSILALISQGYTYLYAMSEPFNLLARLEASSGDGTYDLLAFAPDSQYIASSTTKGIVDIWSVHTFERATSFAAHSGLITSWSAAIGGLDWSTTGYIATGGASVIERTPNIPDYTLKFWKVEIEQ